MYISFVKCLPIRYFPRSTRSEVLVCSPISSEGPRGDRKFRRFFVDHLQDLFALSELRFKSKLIPKALTIIGRQ